MKRMTLGAAAAVMLLLSGAAVRADVMLSETLAMKVARSGVLAVARFVAFEGNGPFTNVQPPTATFRVSQPVRGCKAGDLLRVPAWGRSRPPKNGDAIWAETAIERPKSGAEFLLLLDADDSGAGQPRQGPVDVEFPNHLADPDARTIEMVMGLATLRIEVSTPADVAVRATQPVELAVTLQNDAQAVAQFDPASLRLSATTPKGDSVQGLAPVGGAQAVVHLAPGEKRKHTWTLSSLFPMLFVDPGDYWLQIEVPAQGGDRITRHVEIVDASLEYTCGKAMLIVRTRVVPVATGQVRLDDPIYLRLRGDRLPEHMAWPANTALPPVAKRVFLCGTSAGITWVEEDNAVAQSQIRSLIDGDAPDLWPRDEERDGRFAPSLDAPAVEQRRSGIERRLQVP